MAKQNRLEKNVAMGNTEINAKEDLIKANFKELESILNQNVSYDTDLNDFLLISGWNYSGCIYNSMDEKLKNKTRDYITMRKNVIPWKDRQKELRFSNCIRDAYGVDFKTIGDFKNYVEVHGTNLRNFGYRTLAHFNDALRKYGIDPIKVGGRQSPYYLKQLKKCHLEPANK